MSGTQVRMVLGPPPVASKNLDVNEFLFVNGRYPSLGDPVAPWKYRGWLLPYVQTAEMQLRGTESRWDYMNEIVTTGELPDRAIPKLRFGRRGQDFGGLDKWARINGYDMGGWHDFGVLLDWFLWGLALSREEPSYYREDAAERLYTEVNLEEMLTHPYDYFGAFISEHKSKGWNHTGVYPTPHEVCECMVLMQMADEDMRSKIVLEPCVGTGRMLLHASQFSLRLYGSDIDPVVIKCCLINGALYAPWLSYHIPDAVFGDPPADTGRQVCLFNAV